MPVWLRTATLVLWLTAAAGLIAAAIGVLTEASWLPNIGIPAAATSLVVLTLWFAALPAGGKLGAAFDVGLLVWWAATA